MVPHANICAGLPTHVWDTMPGDVVASVVLATAAAMAAGAAPALLAKGDAARAASCPFGEVPLVPFVPPVSWAAREAGVPSTAATAAGTAGEGAAEGSAGAAAGVAGTAGAGTAIMREGASLATAPAQAPPGPAAAAEPAGAAVPGTATVSAASAGAAAGPAGTAGPTTPAAAAGAASVAAQPGRVMVVHACTGTTYPVTLREGYNDAVEFVRAHPPPFRWGAGQAHVAKQPCVLCCIAYHATSAGAWLSTGLGYCMHGASTADGFLMASSSTMSAS